MIAPIVFLYFIIAFAFSIYVHMDIKEAREADPNIHWLTVPLNGLIWPYHFIRWLLP